MMEKETKMDMGNQTSSDNKKHVPIALCFDENLAKHVDVLIYSLSNVHAQELVDVHIVYRSLSQERLEHLEYLSGKLENITLYHHLVDEHVLDARLISNYSFPLESYFRFLLPELLSDIPRVIYLDVDILVNQSLSELVEMDLGQSCIAAVVEKDMGAFKPGYAEKLGLSAAHYFNSGVLLLDLEAMRRRQLSQELLELAIARYNDLSFRDQDVLNLYFKDEIVFLDKGYNYTNYRMRFEQDSTNSICIFHFNGPIKPWDSLQALTPALRPFAARYQELKRECSKLFQSTKIPVSLVVPVQGDCSHILHCLSSMMQQTHIDIEVLVLIEEISQELREQLEEFQIFDDRIQLVECFKEQSVWQAISTIASGDYVGVVLPNDFLEATYLQSLLEVVEQEVADVVVSGYYELDVLKGVFRSYPDQDGSREVLPKNLLEEEEKRPFLGQVWGKLFRRDVIEAVEKTVHPSLDEREWMANLYAQAQHIVYQKGNYFCHRLHFPNEHL